jgi:hypothetical protein
MKTVRSFLPILLLVVLACIPLWATFPGFTYNQFNNFEQCSNGNLSAATCLTNSDAIATGTWSLNQAHTYLSVQAAAQGTELGTSGSHGFQYSGNTSLETGPAPDVADYALPSGQGTVVLSFFLRTGNCTTSFTECNHDVVFFNSGFGDLTRIADELSSFDNTRELRISNCSTSVSTCRVAVSDSTGYWVSFRYIQNGSSDLHVYNTSYNSVGTATYAFNTNQTVTDILMGGNIATTYNTTFTFYVDDLTICWNTCSFPALPVFTNMPPVVELWMFRGFVLNATRK